MQLSIVAGNNVRLVLLYSRVARLNKIAVSAHPQIFDDASHNITPMSMSKPQPTTATSQYKSEAKSKPPIQPWLRAIQDILDKEPWESKPQPVQLLPWLYLSDVFTVHNHGALLEHGITHVLTTATLPTPRQVDGLRCKLAGADIQHFYCPGQDFEGYDMIGTHWEQQCRPFLEGVRNGNQYNKVVVHCAAGMNRSALIAAAAMMVLERKPLLEVVQIMKSKRGTVLANRSFQKQLCLLAQREGLLGDKPAENEDEPAQFIQPATK